MFTRHLFAPEVSSEIGEDFPFSSSLKSAFLYVVRSWEAGFPGLDHHMVFSPQEGFVHSDVSEHSGQVFQHSILAQLLLEAQKLGVKVSPLLIAPELQLIGKLRRKSGGWAYFRDLKELACDLDTLAEIVRLNQLSGLALLPPQELQSLLDPIQGQQHGPLSTWYYPEGEDQANVQRAFSEGMWGNTADPEVQANFFEALLQADLISAREIEAEAAAVAKLQELDGHWPSTWYCGPMYGTFQAVRMLIQFPSQESALEKAAQFLISQAKGNFTPGENLLDAAYAIRTMQAMTQAGIHDFSSAIRPLAANLYQTQTSQGGWPAEPWIRMVPGRLSGGTTEIVYQSAIMTSILILQTLIHHENHQ